jgi:hypothetical protein
MRTISKRHAILATVPLAVLALTAACGSSAPPTASATTTTAPSPAPASTSPMNAWCHGAGAGDYQAAQNDITRLSGDLNAGSTGNFDADASKLNAAASTAEANPPPGTTAQKVAYVEYMGAITFAMAFLSQGNISEAETAMNGAAKYLNGPVGVNNTIAACG